MERIAGAARWPSIWRWSTVALWQSDIRAFHADRKDLQLMALAPPIAFRGRFLAHSADCELPVAP